MEHQSFSKIKVWLTLTLAVCSFSLFSQTGTVFWATAPYSTPSHDANHTIHVVVSSMSSPASVTLSIPANLSFTPITINLPANSTDYFDFNSLMLPLVEESEWDQKTNKGILIESSDVITAYLEVFSTYNSDIFALKGKNGLGTDFYTPFETNWGNHNFGCSGAGCVQAYSSINIVATEINTTVWITPSVDVYKNSTGVHPAGVPYSVTLDKGQSFTVRANDITAVAQPSGTHITSDKPISVTISDDSMQIGSAYDIVGDQLVPVNVEGSQYIAMKGYLTDEYVYGVISENTTKISINGTLRAKTYNKGDTLIVKLAANTTVIQSDNKQKFNIFHVSGKADEAGGAILPPTDQCTGSLQVGFNFGHAETGNYLYLNLMCRVGAESNFLVDGATAFWLTPATFTPVSGTSWSVARFTLTNVDLAKGNHTISNTKDFFHLGYINYTGPGSEYGYFSDFEKLDVAAVAIKSNTDTAVACTGEELQLRVDGGVNYSWTGKNTATNADASMYLSSKTIYNPKVLGTIPMGFYSFTVNVSSACSGPIVSKTIKIEVVQSPADQTKIVDFCESEVGSGCVNSINLPTYSSLMTNNWPTGVVTKWEKDAYNDMVMLDNYDGIRVVNYGTKNAKLFNMAYANPLPTSPINSSATVLRFDVGGGSTGKFILNNQSAYPFDLNNGAIFRMKIMNTVLNSWSATAFRSVTMKLKNNTDSATVTANLSKYDKWEQLTFDFSALPKKVYTTMEITLNGKDYEQDIFYIDDIEKQFNYRKEPIPTPSSTQICSPEKIYATVEDANGCSANSILTPNIKAGSFAVGNPAITVCQTGTTVGEATGVDLASYTTNITNNVAGLSIVRWDKTYTNYDSIYENFNNVTGKLTWNTAQKVDASGNSLGNTTMNVVNTINNIKSPIQNTSTKVASIYSGGCNGYMASTDLVNPIDLSQGWVFKIMASYWTSQWANNSSTQSIKMTLSGSSGTVSVGPTSIHHTSSNNTASDSSHIWNDLTFDFTAFKTQKGFDRISIYFISSNYGVDSFYFDNFHRIMQPFLASTTTANQTVQNGDKVNAIVKDASGCLVKSTITFTVKDCGPPAIDQTDTMCEASLGSGNVTAINLTNYNNAIKGGVTANTVTWYSNAALTTAVATPTNVTVTNGLTFYALVKDLVKVKQDTATLKFIIKSLPNIVFPTINPVCEASSTYTITGTTPAGGTWSGGAYISAAGVFDPTKATVGAANSVTYSVTVNGCSSTKNTSVTVNTNPTPTLVTAAKDLLYCGTAGVPVSVSNNTGATYYWTKNGSAIAGTTNSQTGLTSGTYAVTATLNGCSKSVTGIIVTGHVVPVYTVTGGGKYCDDTVKKQDITITLTQGDTPWNVYYKNGASKWNQTSISGTTYTIPTANLSAGTYILDSLTNAYCKATVSAGLSATLTEVKRPTTSLQTTDFNYCGTASDVTLTVAAFTPASYQWKQGSTVVGNNSNSYANASAGTYSVTLTNDICQTTISNIIVTAFAKPTYSFSGGGIFCAGKTINPVILTLAGKAPWTVTYRIDGTDHPVLIASSPYTVPQTIDGTYDIKSISDANTCTGDINTGTNGSATITINSLPTVTFAYVDSICQTTPTINLSTKVSPKTGGIGLYSGTGVNATTGLFTHLGPNSYALMYTFTTTAGCVDSAKRTIKVNENPISSITPDPAAICIQKNIILDGNPTKGTTPYSHLWTDALGVSTGLKTNQTITVNTAIANTYSIDYTVTDKNGCKGTDNISVKVNGLPTITVTASPTAVCNGLNSTISAIGASSYVWNTPAGTVNPSTTTTYIVTGTDGNGCINTASTILTVNALPTVLATASAPTICIGKATTISASGANTYVWNPTSVGTINPTNTTTYYVTGTDTKGCTGTSNILVTVNQLPTIVAVASPSAICNGASSTLTVSGANTYAWDNPLGSGTTKTVSPTATKMYTVTGTDGNSCINSTTVQVTVNALPTIIASPLASICSGVSATISASGATNYSWDNLLGIGSSKTVSPTATTTYSVTGTDGNNCSNTASTKITVNAIPTVIASASSPTICIGKSTTVSATGANNYVWNPAGGLVSPISSATYYVTGTDLKGCSATSSTIITVNQLPTIVTSATLSAICIGANTTVSATGANTYIWSPSAGVVSPIVTTTYYVTGTDGVGCINTGNIKITVNNLPTVTASTSPAAICKGFSSTLTANGATNYIWSSTNSTASFSISPTITTIYTVTGTDGNSCSNTASTTITVNQLPTVVATASLPTICIGNTSVIGATGASTYSWNPASGSLTPTSTTTYYVTGSDAKGCIGTASTTVKVNQLPTIIATASPSAICIGTNSTVSATGANTYSWNPSAGIVSPTSTTNYIVTGTDVAGCFNTATVTVTVHTLPTINPTVVPAIICKGDNATVSATGANTYSWNPSAGSVSPTVTTTYSVTGTDGNGCSNTANTTLAVNALPTVIAAASIPTICIGKTTNISASGANNYIWSATAGMISPSNTTIYTVTGTDLNGCIGTSNVTVTVNQLPTATWNAINDHLLCSDGAISILNISISPSSVGGTGTFPLTVAGMNKASETSATFDPTLASSSKNSFDYFFTDKNGCISATISDTMFVNVTPKPSAKSASILSTPIPGAGVFKIDVSTDNYKNVKWYALSQSTNIASGNVFAPTIGIAYPGIPKTGTTPDSLVPGIYKYLYTQTINGCESKPDTATFTVTSCPAPLPTPGVDPKPCTDITLSTILSAKANGTGSIQWFAGATSTSTKLGAPSSTYTVTTTTPGTYNYYVAEYDALASCYGPIATVQLTINALPTISATASASPICLNETSTLTASGANAYIWNTSIGSGNGKTVSPNTTTSYIVTGTDGKGCQNTTSVNVIVNALPTIIASSTPSSICIGASSVIKATGASTYVWDNSLSPGDSKTITPTISTIYNVIGTDVNGCVGSASTSVTVNALPTIIASVSSPAICNGKSTIISASGAKTYSWDNVSVSGSGNSINPTISTTYSVTGTDINNCINTASVSVIVNQLPTVTWSTSNPHIICSDGNIVTLNVITVPTGGTGVFGSTIGLTKSATSETSASLDPKATGAGTKTLNLDYTYTDLNGCITAVKQDTIRIFDTPEPTDTSINTMSTPIPASYKFDVTIKSLTNVNWYNDPQSAVIGTGNVYIPIISHTNTSPDSLVAGCHNYLFTQTINGCESQPAKAQECVINCPAQAPISGIIPKPCTDVTLSTLLTATAKGSGMLHWFDNSNTKTANDLGTGNSLTITETKAKTYTYYVAEYDASKACFGPTTPVTLTINPNPTVAILNNPSKVCQAEPSFTINATPIGGTFSGSGINTTGTFDPSASVTLNSPLSITYSYTNPTTSCKHDTTFSITVNQKPVVTIGSKSSLINTPLVALVGVSDMTGGTFNWFDSTGANKGSGVNFIPSSIITNTTKISKHKLTYTHTSDEGCVSIPAEQTYTLFDCPAPQPTPTDNRKCIDDATKQPTVSAKANGTGTLYWFTADNAKIGTEAGTGLSFNTAKTLAGTHTFYVAEYDAVNTCFGPTAVANLIIDALPIVDINIADSVLCYDENAVTLNVNKGIPSGPFPLGVITGSTAVTGTTFTPNKLITDTSATTSQTTNLVYTYTDIHGCKNSDSQQITVNFTKHPTTTDAQYLFTQIKSGTQPNLSVTGTAGATFNWYTDYALTGTPVSGTPFNTGLTAVTALSGTDYWATQTVNGCQSLPTVANIKIVLCPTPVPTVKNESVCENVSIPNLTAIGTKLNWYSSANGSTTVTTEGATTFAHGNTIPGTYTYYVSQKLVDGITGNECEGPRNPIKITILPKPTVTITNTVTHLCIDNSPITINTKISVAGTGLFAESFLTNVTSTKADFDPKKAGVGSQTINYTFTDGNNCIDKTSQTIVVDSTAQVIIAQTFEDMVHNPKPQMTALGTGIKWYTSANLGTPIGTGSPFVDPTISETDVVTKDFWVTQTKNGCESQAIKTKLIIDACPVQLANIDKNNFKQCTYDNSPSLTASSGTGWPLPPSAKRGFYWYTSKTATSPVFVGNPYNPSVNGQTGVQTYYVAEYDSQYTCFGTRQKISFTIVPVAAPGVLSINDICSGEANQTFKIDQALALNKYLWYGTADTLKGKLAIGTSFTPSDKTVGTHSYWAASTDENGCHSVVTPIAMTIKPRPGKPTLANDESCEGLPIKTLTASGDVNAIFEWYKGDSTLYSATIASYTPSITATTVFFVRQNLNSCRGWFAPDTYTVKSIPALPIVENKDICENNPIPTFTTNATGLINWYSQSQTFIGNNNPFTPSTKTTSDFYVSQTVKECESPKTKVTFTVHILPSKPIVTDNMHRCENFGNASVVVTSGTNIKWYAKNDTNTTAISKGSMKYSYTNKKSGEYHIFVTQTDAYNCQSEAFDAITFIDSVPTKPIINEPSIAICEYDGIPTLTCNNNNTIIWYTDGMDSIKSGNSFTPIHSQLKTGNTRNFVVRVLSSNNCISLVSDKVGITVKQTPHIPTFTTYNVCTDDSNIIVFKNKNGIYTIDNNADNSQWKTDSIFTVPSKYMETDGDKSFEIFQTINGCSSDLATATFTVFKRPKPLISGKYELCENSYMIPYNVVNKNNGSIYKWSVTGNRVLYRADQSSQNFASNIDYNEMGIDTIKVMENNGYCIGTGTLVVRVAPAPTADFQWEIPGGMTQVYFQNTSTQNDIIDGKTSEPVELSYFRWRFNRESDKNDSLQSLASYKNNDNIKIRYNYGNHEATLVAINSYGCSDSITKKFFVDLAEGLYMPNSFVPMSPILGISKFLPKGFNLETYNISIYDVWGNLLWYSDKLIDGSPAEGWDGTCNGVVMKMDSYVWKVEATFKDGKEFGDKHGKNYSKFGNVLLIR